MVKQSNQNSNLIQLDKIYQAKARLQSILQPTPLMLNAGLSAEYDCEIYLKREDLQQVRSYKIRGAYNKMASCDASQLSKGVVCASAGNHAQGVALACSLLQVPGKIFMPTTTPDQKIKKVKFFGKALVEIILIGDSFDDSFSEAKKHCDENDLLFVHPFDDEKVMEGQATVGAEIMEQIPGEIDYIFLGIGGGGLAAGLGSFIKQVSPQTKIIGVEPAGAPAMHNSLAAGEVITLDKMDTFVDGAAVKRVGEKTFQCCQQILQEVSLVAEGKICQTILKLYNEEAIVAEPAGALSISALDHYRDAIKGKRIVCVLSGGNNDITRTEEIKERALLHQGLKHYFIIRFPQRAGALREFLNDVLGPEDDITHFEYTKKHNRESGPALVGLVLKRAEDYEGLLERMRQRGVGYRAVNGDDLLYGLLV